MGSYRVLWGPIGFCGVLRGSVRSDRAYGVLWGSYKGTKGSYRVLWGCGAPMGSYGVLWASMGSYGIL